MARNYWKATDFSIIRVPYMYIDHYSYLADNLFIQRKIRVWYKREYAKDGIPYRLVFCRVLRGDSERFEEALEKLKDKMLLMGHLDYEGTCAFFEDVLSDNKSTDEH